MTARRSENNPPRSVRLSEVAAELNLSKGAVSRVLSQVPASRSIPPATQARIFSVAKRMGYVPNQLARSLKQGRSATIAAIVPTLQEAHTALILSGVEDAIGESHRACMVIQHHRDLRRINASREEVSLRRVDGLITISSALPWTPKVPLVTIACPGPLPNACNIQLNHDAAAQIGLEHLRSLGHRQVALICGQDESPDAQPRAEAILRRAIVLQMSFDPALIEKLEGDEPSVEPGYRATKRRLTRKRSFTAIFTFNDYTAIGSIRALREGGFRVPEDVAVLGVDDVQPAAYNDPPLTTIRQPLFEMGQLAARKLMARLECSESLAVAELISIQPQLVVRRSA